MSWKNKKSFRMLLTKALEKYSIVIEQEQMFLKANYNCKIYLNNIKQMRLDSEGIE